jgi:hypothetical protein
MIIIKNDVVIVIEIMIGLSDNILRCGMGLIKLTKLISLAIVI